jgi:thymidylate synthase
MFQVIEAVTADEAWQTAVAWFLPDGISVQQPSRGGRTVEVLHSAISIRNPRQRWIGSRFPAINPAFAIAEAIWIAKGRNDSGFLNYFNPSLPKFAGDGPTYHGAYGFRLRRHFDVDQLDRAFRALTANPDSRQVALQIWDSQADLPDENGTPRSPNIPCNVMALLKVRDGRLMWTQIMRSNDLFRGLPHNVVQFTFLQEIMAGWLAIDVGPYNHLSDSLHLYADVGVVRDRLRPTVVPDSTDRLDLPKKDSDTVLSVVSDFGDFVANACNTSRDVVEALSHLELPQAYNNLALLLASDAVRRRGDTQLAVEVSSRSTDACLRFMMERWLERMRLRNAVD